MFHLDENIKKRGRPGLTPVFRQLIDAYVNSPEMDDQENPTYHQLRSYEARYGARLKGLFESRGTGGRQSPQDELKGLYTLKRRPDDPIVPYRLPITQERRRVELQRFSQAAQSACAGTYTRFAKIERNQKFETSEDFWERVQARFG
jgi:hypothetical protein